VTGLWFSLVTTVSSTNKTDRDDIHVTEKLLKVMLNTIILTLTLHYSISFRVQFSCINMQALVF